VPAMSMPVDSEGESFERWDDVLKSKTERVAGRGEESSARKGKAVWSVSVR
jgi:hypothetical protein